MELGGHSIPPACYYGCPDPAVRRVVAGLAESANDVQKATAAGVSANAVNAIRASRQSLEDRAETIAQHIPSAPDSVGPWIPNTEGLPRTAASVLGTLTCCRVSGVVGIGHASYHLTRVES